MTDATKLWLTFILGVLGGLCAFLLFRNVAVRCHRKYVLAMIAFFNARDVEAGNFDYAWRLELFKRTSYTSMLLRFWRPVASLMPVEDFARLPERGPPPPVVRRDSVVEFRPREKRLTDERTKILP